MKLKSLFRKSIFLLKHLSFSSEEKLQMVSQVSERRMSIYCISRHIVHMMLDSLPMLGSDQMFSAKHSGCEEQPL